MEKILGKYQHYKNENIDEYFTAVGVPYFARKMMLMTSPSLDISLDGDRWTVKNVTMMRTMIQNFVLGEEYEEKMPNGETLKSVTTKSSDNQLVTQSTVKESGVKTSRTYDFDDDNCIITLAIGDVSGKRYFSKVKVE